MLLLRNVTTIGVALLLCLLVSITKAITPEPPTSVLPTPTPKPSASPGNILCLFGAPSRGHHIWNTVVVRALAHRGHNVTILTVVGPSDLDHHQRTHYMHMTGVAEAIHSRTLAAPKKSWIAGYLSHTVYGRITARYVDASQMDGVLVDSDAARQLLDYPEEYRFDLVLHDLQQAQALLGFVDRFGSPPLISVAPSGLPAAWAAGTVTGAVNYPSYQPHVDGVYAHQAMSFIERARNLTYFLYDWFYRTYVYMVNENRKARRLFGATMRDLESIEQRTGVVLANTDFVLDPAAVWPANVVNVGGLHAQRVEILDGALQTFLDTSVNGTIYVHLGDNAFENPTHQRYLLLRVFKALTNLHFVWVTNEPYLKRLPRNVFAARWAPQNAILSHANVKLFLTNGGRLSVQESVWHSVPFMVVGQRDHHSQSVRKATMAGCAASLVVGYNDTGRVVKTIQNVLTSTSYSTNIQRLSERFRSQSSAPLDRAVHEIESVLRFGDADHLRPSCTHLYFFQAHLVDVWLVFVGLVLSFVMIFINHCCLRRRSGHVEREVPVRLKTE